MSHPANHICQKACEITLVSDILITSNKWLVVFRGQDLQSQGFTWAICSQDHMTSPIPINRWCLCVSHQRQEDNIVLWIEGSRQQGFSRTGAYNTCLPLTRLNTLKFRPECWDKSLLEMIDTWNSFLYILSLSLKKKNKFKSSYGRFKKWIYFWLHWVLVAAIRLSRVVASEGYSLIVVQGLLLWNTASGAHRLHELWHVGSTVAALRLQSVGLVTVVYGLSCPTCEIFSDQESYPCPLHWQADS